MPKFGSKSEISGQDQVSDDSMLEVFGAVMTCLARAIALATPAQLDLYEDEIRRLSESVDSASASINVFYSVLREIESRRARFNLQ